jgi:hypothetical protein
LEIIFEVSKRDVADQICQHSATMYCTCSNSNATKTTTTKEYFWHIIGLEGAYPSTKNNGSKTVLASAKNYDKGGKSVRSNEKPLSVSHSDSI